MYQGQLWIEKYGIMGFWPKPPHKRTKKCLFLPRGKKKNYIDSGLAYLTIV
jgi:hypothetical protein